MVNGDHGRTTLLIIAHTFLLYYDVAEVQQKVVSFPAIVSAHPGQLVPAQAPKGKVSVVRVRLLMYEYPLSSHARKIIDQAMRRSSDSGPYRMFSYGRKDMIGMD